MEKPDKENVPAAVGPYSQAVACGDFVFVSGQLGIDPGTGALAEGIEAQSERAIRNVGAILGGFGLNYENAVKTTCFLKSIDDFALFNRVYAKHFTGKPARSCVGVSELPKGALVEIEVIACTKPNSL